MDEVEVFDRALSTSEIQEIYDAGSAGKCKGKVDHYTFYKVKTTKDTPKFAAFGPIVLADQFGSAEYDVTKPKRLGLPADKNGEGRLDAVTHLKAYQLRERAKGSDNKFQKRQDVHIVNQCNDLLLEVSKPNSLLVPTNKDLTEQPPPPDESEHNLAHFLCYKAKAQKNLADGTKLPKFAKGIQVVVEDQFQTRRYDLKKITKLCNPADKSGESAVFLSGPNKGEAFPVEPAAIRNPETHLVCYQAKQAIKTIAQDEDGCGPLNPADKGEKIDPKQQKHQPLIGIIHVNNQFGPERLDSVKEEELCLPSVKIVED